LADNDNNVKTLQPIEPGAQNNSCQSNKQVWIDQTIRVSEHDQRFILSLS